MSPSDAKGSRLTVTASWKALTTQIEAEGEVCSSCAIVGRAMLAIAVLRTEMATAIAIVRMARRRAGCGNPSVSSIPPSARAVQRSLLLTEYRRPARQGIGKIVSATRLVGFGAGRSSGL